MSETQTDPSAVETTVADVVRDFAAARNRLPNTSIRWALENWAVAAPHFLALLANYADGTDRTPETTDALFYIVHLVAEKREAGAFAPLCRMLYDTDATDMALGDATTESLTGVIISTFDGDLEKLKALIAANEVDEYVRSGALEALAYLTRSGAQSDDEMRDFLWHLMTSIPHDDIFLWSTWAICAATLGYEDFTEKVRELTKSGVIHSGMMRFKDFQEQLARTLADPTRMAGFEHDKIAPFTDTIGTLSTWHFASKPENTAPIESSDERIPDWSAGLPHTNPLRHVGRNDPCPCGSGKKFKKCCGA